MNNAFVKINTTAVPNWVCRYLIWLIFFICIFLLDIGAINAKEVQQSGDSCNTKNKLPPSLLCIEGSIVDCHNSNDSRELLHCVSSELQKANTELSRLYQSVIKKLTKSNDEYTDYKTAQRSFIEGQSFWLKFKKSDCEVLGYLNLKGSTQSNEIVNCELKHTKNRITDLGLYLASFK
jgi:uncharacterized protein YecT (DUF1311 family)